MPNVSGAFYRPGLDGVWYLLSARNQDTLRASSTQVLDFGETLFCEFASTESAVIGQPTPDHARPINQAVLGISLSNIDTGSLAFLCAEQSPCLTALPVLIHADRP